MNYSTVPQICSANALPLEVARRLIRKSPALAAMAHVFGTARLYDEAGAAAIVQAVRDHRSKHPTWYPVAVGAGA